MGGWHLRMTWGQEVCYTSLHSELATLPAGFFSEEKTGNISRICFEIVQLQRRGFRSKYWSNSFASIHSSRRLPREQLLKRKDLWQRRLPQGGLYFMANKGYTTKQMAHVSKWFKIRTFSTILLRNKQPVFAKIYFSVYFPLFPYPKNFSHFFSSHWKK